MSTPEMLLIDKTVRHAVNLLVQKKYDELEALTKAIRLKAQYIKAGVVEYGRTLVFPPESAFENIDVIQITGQTPCQYSVRFDLYTEEEGRSDLTLEMTLIYDDPIAELMRVEIDNIHVL